MNSKANIYKAAAILFEQKGFKACTVRDIAHFVQLEPSSLYSHIKSKDEILENICQTISLKYENGLNEVLTSSLTLLQKIEQVFFVHIDIAIEDPTSITVFNDEWKHLKTPYLEEFIEHRISYESKLIELIQSAQKEGLVKDSSADLIVNTMISSLQWIHKLSNLDKIKDKSVLKKEIAELLLNGISI